MKSELIKKGKIDGTISIECPDKCGGHLMPDSNNNFPQATLVCDQCRDTFRIVRESMIEQAINSLSQCAQGVVDTTAVVAESNVFTDKKPEPREDSQGESKVFPDDFLNDNFSLQEGNDVDTDSPQFEASESGRNRTTEK